MAAGLGYKTFTRETLSVSDVQGYLMNQAVMRFDSASQRSSKVTTPTDGMVSYREDIDQLEYYEAGAYWRPVSSRWPDHTSGSLPSTGVRNGETIYSSVYQCGLIRVNGAWVQASVTTGTSLSTFKASLTAAGLTFLHNGFLYFDTNDNRLYMCVGNLDFYLVQGAKNPSRTTTGFPTVAGSGWSYVTGGATWIRSLGDGTATMNLEVSKTGTGLAIPTDGNITNGQVGQVPPGWEPLESTPLTSSGTGRIVHGYIGTGGDIVMTAVATTPTIAVGETCSLAGNFRLADAAK